MDDNLKQIIQKYEEFNQFLNNIDLTQLRKLYTRAELNELEDTIRAVKLRSLSYDISQMTKEMKQEEYPQLLGVHHFPVIKKIDFLSEEKKIELDKFLVYFRVGEYVMGQGFYKVTKSREVIDKIYAFFAQNGIVEKQYFALCPSCRQSYISTVLNEEQKKKIDDALLLDKDNAERYEILSSLLDYICQECDYSAEIDNLTQVDYKTSYRMIAKRDTSLDNV